MKRGATILIGEDRIILHPNDSSTDGCFIGNPIRLLAHCASAEQILAELNLTLADCMPVSPPGSIKASEVAVQPFLRATGKQSREAVTQSFACINIREDEGALLFESLRPARDAHLWFIHTGKSWRCNPADHDAMLAGFRNAAIVAMEASNLQNPPLLS